MKPHLRHYQAGDITFRINSEFPITDHTFHPKFKLFEADDTGKSEVIINHRFSLPDPYKTGNITGDPVYQKDQWKVVRTHHEWVYFFHPVFPEDPDYSLVGVFNHNHTRINIYTTDINKEAYAMGQFKALTLFQTDQMLFAKLLCDRKGLIFHSNGFDINGKGIIALGQSGAGKSTLSAMFKKRGKKTLCDDRTFVAARDGEYWAHGSWCHGSVPDISPLSVPLKGIFILEQSQTDTIAPVDNRSVIFHSLIPSIVKPFLDSGDWDTMLETVEDIIKKVKIYHLTFNLSGEICKMIETLMEDL